MGLAVKSWELTGVFIPWLLWLCWLIVGYTFGALTVVTEYSSMVISVGLNRLVDFQETAELIFFFFCFVYLSALCYPTGMYLEETSDAPASTPATPPTAPAEVSRTQPAAAPAPTAPTRARSSPASPSQSPVLSKSPAAQTLQGMPACVLQVH